MNENVWPLILLGGGLLAFLLLVSFLSKNYSLNNFKNKTVGDGQHGTARWATPKEIHTTYHVVPFRPRRWRKGEDLPAVQGIILGSMGGRKRRAKRGVISQTTHKLLERLRRPTAGKKEQRKPKKKKTAISKIKNVVEDQQDVRALVDSDDIHCLTPRWMSPRSRSCCRRLCSTPILRGGWLRMDEFTALFSRKDMTFEEAVAYFKERVPVTASRFYQIAAEYRALAFTVSGYTKAQVLKKFYDELLAALEEGNSLAEFRENMNDFLEAEGYEGITPYQAENIFRTNIQTAYNVGHYKRMTEPGVKALRPYWQYDAVNDSKTRPSHLAMDGRVFMADDPIWDTWFPPNGFKCRCTVKTLSKRQMEQRGLTVETEAPRAARLEDGRFVNILPDPQFDTNPAKVRYQPDLTGYPEPLKKAYQEREKGNTPP